MRRIEIGQRFGRLVVLQHAPDVFYKGKEQIHRRQAVLCECDCGKQKIIVVASLLHPNGGTKSCGCMQKEVAGKAMKDSLKAFRAWRKSRGQCKRIRYERDGSLSHIWHAYKCSNCGEGIGNTANFCSGCGYEIGGDQNDEE